MRSLRLRLRARSRRRGDPAPFIVGYGYSGTTLLRLMLDAHPALAIPPETNFLPQLISRWTPQTRADDVAAFLTRHRRWGDFHLDAAELGRRLAAAEPLDPGEAARIFYRLYAESHGKQRWGDKTPRYALRLKKISRVLPEARFVHLIRDGRDVALSTLQGRDPTPDVAASQARRWKRRIARARRGSAHVDHYLEIRYEDLVADTEVTLRRVCELVALPWDDSILRYHEHSGERLQEMASPLPARGRTVREEADADWAARRLHRHRLTTAPPNPERIGVWRREMGAESRRAFEAVAGELLADLGYETSGAGGRGLTAA